MTSDAAMTPPQTTPASVTTTTPEPATAGYVQVIDGAKFDDSPAMAVEFVPFGGAQSFAAFDDFERARDQEFEVREQSSIFDGIVGNIMRDPDMNLASKATAVAAAANEMASRVASADGQRQIGHTPGALSVARDKQTGAMRWVALYSNNYKDREGETFSAASHEAFIEHVKATRDFPTLRLFHVPVDIGRADALDYADGFMVASGTFSKEFEYVGESLAGTKDLACSHGYSYNPADLIDGVYHRYRTFEVTALPAWAAANELTSMGVGEDLMPLDTDVRTFMVEHMGESQVARIESGLGEMKSRAEAQGIAFKDVLASLGAKDEPETAAAVAEPPAAEPEPAAEATPPAAAAAAAPSVEATPAAEAAPESEAPAAEAAPPAEEEPAAPATGPTEEQAAEATRALGDMIRAEVGAALTAALQPVAADVAVLGQRMSELEATDGAKLAARWTPKVGPNGATPASQSEGNVIDEKAAQEMTAGAGAPVGEGEKAATPVDGYMGDMRRVMAASPANNGAAS